jgi:Tfp pilus assembly protein PilO
MVVMDQSLALLLLLLVVLIVCSLGWCLLSSCMGQSLAELWHSQTRPRLRRPFGEEMWEMERRRGPF